MRELHRSSPFDSRGFTLIELVVVIVIIAIMIGVAVQSGAHLYEAAKVEETRQEMDALATAITGNPELVSNGVRSDFGYVGDVGAMPPDLDALFSNPGSYATWNGPYVSNQFTQIVNDYKTDAFGVEYSYAGGATITSIGSGSNMVRRVTNATDDLLRNTVAGNIYDLDGTPPGTGYEDSVTITITIPNGLGGTTTIGMTPDHGGFFAFGSIPVGNHDLVIVYQPDDDTLSRFVSVLPGSDGYGEYRLSADVW
jgi:prepilin-type N-terminal cleavage/methylation domain-containing protein